MTEAEWLTCTDPQLMLDYLASIPTDRKLRLFACACCRRRGDLLIEPHHVRILQVAEALADGRADLESLRAEREHLFARDYALWAATHEDPYRAAVAGSRDIAIYAGQDGYAVAGEVAVLEQNTVAVDAAYEAESVEQTSFLRDIFRNPFRPIAINPRWLTPDVRTLAEGIYAEKAFDRMPILADALQDAGCDNDDILNHCRQPGEHVRGCWVVDLLLGKT
ncbi:hypothetical protein R5W23_003649 [Gemmata sp. JC673]|uniref:SMI1/KNR4 family protein n=1 Tax=Gemmata algarum TaxID=2975278 RepID=A0ABU5EUV4_9BACT|nr:hypothetical protein [Gemmata algarum]MDY3558225.1 hypothetical protein [Gemmata algarum]